jgi:pimeloyl-ACP methyl ester carboxylesterase
MPLVKVGDINMYYEAHGRGEPLVMICGASATTESYAVQLPLFSEKYKVVLFDNRGAGRTDKPDISYSMAMMADDMAGLLEAIGIESAHIYGQSMGGMIAQEFVLRHPEKVRKLVLVSTSCGNRHGVPTRQSRRFDREQRAKMTPDELGEETLRLCVTDEFIEKRPEIARVLKEAMMQQSKPAYAMLRQAEAARSHDTWERLPEIKAPTLIIAGDADAAVPAENSRILASRIPGSELTIYENAGHILIEAGNRPNRLILDFLER